MVHSCNKKNCPYRKSNKRQTMRGGGCPCNKSSGLFSGGRRRKTSRRSYRRQKTGQRRKTMRGGSAGLSALSSSAYYPQNDYMNDMSDPSKQIAGRFSGVPTVSPTSTTLMKGGGCDKTYKHRYPPKKGKRMQGGSGMFASNNFLGTFGNSSGINTTSGTWLGANTVNTPSYLQSAISPYSDNTYAGYNAQNPYLV